MFESLPGAILAHKQTVIAAIAISGLLLYAFPTITEAAHRQFNFDRTIQIPCAPYCNIATLPEINVDANPVHVRIGFSLVNVNSFGSASSLGNSFGNVNSFGSASSLGNSFGNVNSFVNLNSLGNVNGFANFR